MTLTETITGGTPTSVALVAIKRSDTNAAPVGVTCPLAYTNAGGGVWNVTFSDANPDACQYLYQFTLTFGATTVGPYSATKASDGTTSPICYFASTLAADRYAATLPAALLAAYLAASSGDKFAALIQATADIDAGMRFQGRRYDPAQLTEFPRVAYETAGRVRPQGIITLVIPPAATDTVWDWDPVNQVPIVPPKVYQAVVYQANSILDGGREPRLGDIHDGVGAQANTGVSESYDPAMAGVATGICRRAWQLLKPYQLVSGRLV